MPNKRVLITIVTWNRWRITRDTLRSFKKLNGPDHDFLIVDNASTDKTVKCLRKRHYNVIVNKTNEGCFLATRKAWIEACAMGYDFVLNLQNDFPCIKPVPFNDIFTFMDNNLDVGFVQLNDKKYLFHEVNGEIKLKRKKERIINVFTKKKLKFKTGFKVGDTEFWKSNHHISFNPCIIRTSIISQLVGDIEEAREFQIMKNFDKLGLKGARVKNRCFETVIRKREGEWKR